MEWAGYCVCVRAAIVSDVHIGRLNDAHQHHFVRWLDALDAEQLILLGDVFHWWWGVEGLVLAEFVPVLAALERVRRRGIPICYVPGNHDFALGPFFKESLGVTVSPRVEASWGGRRFLLVHGDEPDTSLGYRFTRRALRGRPFAALMRLAGPRRAQAIGERLAGGSRAMGGDSPNPRLLKAQEDWAQARIDEGFDVVVMGHSHAPGVHALRAGTLVNLGDFVHHFTWLAVREDFELCRFRTE